MENKRKSLVSTIIIIVVIIAVTALAVFMIMKKGGTGVAQGNNTAENQATAEEFVKVLDNGTKLNISSKLSETKVVEGLEISNFQLTESGSQTVLLGKIKNNGSEARGGFEAAVTMLDKQGNEIVKLIAYIPQVKPGEEQQLNVSSTLDYANAYDIKIEKK